MAKIIGSNAVPTKKPIKEHILPAIAIIFFVIVIVGTAIGSSKERERNERFAYQGWCKIHKDMDLTFEEWRAMKIDKMLPEE